MERHLTFFEAQACREKGFKVTQLTFDATSLHATELYRVEEAPAEVPTREVRGMPWFSADRFDQRSQACMVSYRMHAADQWRLLCDVVDGRSDDAAKTGAEALVARYRARLDEDSSSSSDTLRQLSWEARRVVQNALRDAERALERIAEGTFHPTHVIPLVYEGEKQVEELPVMTWEEWVQSTPEVK